MSLETSPYWWRDGAPLPDLPEDHDDTADVVVIGAGFTGLSAALTLARNGADVLVLDAGVPGIGASTRNGGMIGSPHGAGITAAGQGISQTAADALQQEGVEGYEYTVSLIRDLGVACDFHRHGRLKLAYTKDHFETMRAGSADLARNGYDIEILGRAELRDEIGSDLYFGGALHKDHGGLHPRKWHDGLLRAALSAGARIVANTPVTGIARTPKGVTIHTTRGEVRADDVIVATNGYTPWAFKGIRARVFTVPSYLMATEPLSPNMLADIAPGKRMMVETRRRFSYFRLSPDGTRLLLGGRAAIHDIPLATAAGRLRKLMLSIFPQMQDVKIEACWTGSLGFTFNHAPHIGRMDGALFALGYSGNGVALSPWLGHKAALKALGRPEGASAFEQTRFDTRVYRRFMEPAMALASLAQYPIDWAENRANRRDHARG